MASTAPQTDGQKLAGYWISQLELSEKWQRRWVERSRRIIRRYKNLGPFDANDGSQGSSTSNTDNGYNRRFAILWSNTETMKPAVYGRTPSPVVTRRYRDADPVGKYVAEVLERSLEFAIDAYDFDERMMLSRDDYLLLARGQVWIRYVPHIGVTAPEDDEAAERAEGQISNDVEAEGEADSIAYQEVLCDHVAFDDWGMQPCRNWSETGYVWRRAYLTRPELIARFGAKLGNEIPLDWRPKNEESREAEQTEENKAQVYEIWDKTSGKVIWISKAHTMAALDSRPDPLGLTNFFPCPRPLMGTTPQDAYLPIADYVYYQDQAEELDELTQRIGRLCDALRMVGVYASEDGMDLAQMFDGDQNTIIPIKSMASLQDKGGLKGIIEWLPIRDVIETLKGCFEARRQILDDIYQITGMSDIIRGESNPNETATAQRLKGQWGSLRVRDKQKNIARFARDILDLKSQVIAGKFEVETLKAMTDVKLLTQAEKQQFSQMQALYQQAVQMSQAQGMQPPPPPQIPPEAQELMNEPAWEDVIGLMRDKARVQFRIDIETNSTVEPDRQEAKASFTEYVQATASLMQVAATIIPGAPETAPLFAEFFKEGARVFNTSTQMENVVEKVFSQLGAKPPVQPEAAAAPSGPSPEEMQLKQADIQGKQALEAENLKLEQARLQQSNMIDMADLQLRSNEQQLKAVALSRDSNPQSVT
jgi:hypothetical protein